MQFDVIIGNPPYQKPKKNESDGKNPHPLWLDFLKKTGDLIKDGGYTSMLVPASVAKTTRWAEPGRGFKSLSWGQITEIKTGLERFFSVGTEISNIVATTGNQGIIKVNGEIDVDPLKRPWLPVRHDVEAFSLIEKIASQNNNFTFQTTADFSAEERSFGLYRMNQDHGFSTQITSERRKTKANGEPLKLMWINMECASRGEAEKLMKLTHSKLFTAVRRLTFYEPNYAHLFLRGLTYPDQIPTSDEDVYKAYGLTEQEITYVETFQK